MGHGENFVATRRWHPRVAPWCVLDLVKGYPFLVEARNHGFDLQKWVREDLDDRPLSEFSASLVQQFVGVVTTDAFRNLRPNLILPEGCEDALMADKAWARRYLAEKLDRELLANGTIQDFMKATKTWPSAALPYLGKLECWLWRLQDEELDVVAWSKRVLKLKWLGKVLPSDMRFGFTGARTLRDWIEQKVGKPDEWPALRRMLSNLERGELQCFTDEVQWLGAIAANDLSRRWNTPIDLSYVVQHFEHACARAPGVSWATLSGSSYEMDAVNAHEAATMEMIKASGTYLVATEKVLSEFRHIDQTDCVNPNFVLRRLLGPGVGVESAIEFAQRFGLETDDLVVGKRCNAAAGVKSPTPTMWHRPKKPAVDELIVTRACEDSDLRGLSSLKRLLGILSLNDNVAPRQQHIVEVLEREEGFRWIEKRDGWFSIGNGSQHSICGSRARKLLAVAEDGVSDEELTEVLIQQTAPVDTTAKVLDEMPDVRLVRLAVGHWPWIKWVHGKGYVAKTRVGLDVMDAIELGLLETVERFGGVATTHELASRLQKDSGMPPISIMASLRQSPFLTPVERGLWGLRCNRVPMNALAKAQQRRSQREDVIRSGGGLEGAEFFVSGITESSLRRNAKGHVAIQPRFRPGIGTGLIHLANGRDSVEVMHWEYIRSIWPMFDNVEAGDHYKIWVTLDGVMITLVKGMDGAKGDELNEEVAHTGRRKRSFFGSPEQRAKLAGRAK